MVAGEHVTERERNRQAKLDEYWEKCFLAALTGAAIDKADQGAHALVEDARYIADLAAVVMARGRT